jgi:hypothetical protein
MSRGKLKQARRKRLASTAPDHIAHHHLAGEERFLCGLLYAGNNDTLRGAHRPAHTSDRVSCGKCQRRRRTLLLRTPQGRKRLGLTPVDAPFS